MRDAALQVVRRLRDAGHQALWAGGCVRDMLMGREPDDYDVATDARPEQVTALFRRTQQVGAKFGVVLVREGRHAIEVATFRAEGTYADGRRPDEVRFTDAREDALRRDFTINGMFYDPVAEQVLDFVEGQKDLQARVIRAIGDPEHRFAEDHLRMLRAIRFASRFDFTVEPKTWTAIRHHAAEIRRISPERILEELDSILSHPSRPRGFADLAACGLLADLWPGAEGLLPHAESIRAILAALPATANFETALAAVLYDRTAVEIGRICSALRASNRTQDTIDWMAGQLPILDAADQLPLAQLKRRMAHPAFSDLMTLQAARLAGLNRPTAVLDRLRQRIAAIPPDQIAPPPLLTGNDLLAMGLEPGPAYKRILDQVYDAQLEGRIATSDAAVEMAIRLIKT